MSGAGQFLPSEIIQWEYVNSQFQLTTSLIGGCDPNSKRATRVAMLRLALKKAVLYC